MKRSTLICVVIAALALVFAWYIGMRDGSWAFIHNDVGTLLLTSVAMVVATILVIKDGAVCAVRRWQGRE